LLAAVFAVTWWAQRRSTIAWEGYYWIAIVTVRTAATNLGDLATHDLKVPYPWVILALAVVLAIVVAGARPAAGAGRVTGWRLPPNDARYWLAMLLAGTLGTAVGDFSADDLGLGVGRSALVYACVFALLLAFGRVDALRTSGLYWLTVVAVRTMGTNLGDFTVGRHGLGWGLDLATTATGIVFVGLVAFWRPGRTGPGNVLPNEGRPAGTPRA
jgi:uncharacterized membrane-anchored protein